MQRKTSVDYSSIDDYSGSENSDIRDNDQLAENLLISNNNDDENIFSSGALAAIASLEYEKTNEFQHLLDRNLELKTQAQNLQSQLDFYTAENRRLSDELAQTQNAKETSEQISKEQIEALRKQLSVYIETNLKLKDMIGQMEKDKKALENSLKQTKQQRNIINQDKLEYQRKLLICQQVDQNLANQITEAMNLIGKKNLSDQECSDIINLLKVLQRSYQTLIGTCENQRSDIEPLKKNYAFLKKENEDLKNNFNQVTGELQRLQQENEALKTKYVKACEMISLFCNEMGRFNQSIYSSWTTLYNQSSINRPGTNDAGMNQNQNQNPHLPLNGPQV